MDSDLNNIASLVYNYPSTVPTEDNIFVKDPSNRSQIRILCNKSASSNCIVIQHKRFRVCRVVNVGIYSFFYSFFFAVCNQEQDKKKDKTKEEMTMENGSSSDKLYDSAMNDISSGATIHTDSATAGQRQRRSSSKRSKSKHIFRNNQSSSNKSKRSSSKTDVEGSSPTNGRSIGSVDDEIETSTNHNNDNSTAAAVVVDTITAGVNEEETTRSIPSRLEISQKQRMQRRHHNRSPSFSRRRGRSRSRSRPHPSSQVSSTQFRNSHRRSTSRNAGTSRSRSRPASLRGRGETSQQYSLTTIQPNINSSLDITQEQRDRISELVLPHFLGNENKNRNKLFDCCCFHPCGRNENNNNDKQEKQKKKHFRWFSHGKITTLLLIIFAWGGTILSFLSRRSVEFVTLATPWPIAPIYDEVTAIGMINVNLCYNQTMMEMEELLTDDIINHAADEPCFDIPLNIGDMDDIMYKISVSFVSSALYLGFLMTCIITTTIIWQTINMKAVAFGFLFVYAFQSLSFLFFDTDVCKVHECQLGEGCIFSISASILWMCTCVTCAKIDLSRKKLEIEQSEAEKKHRAKGVMKRRNSTCGAETVFTDNSSVLDDSNSLDIELGGDNGRTSFADGRQVISPTTQRRHSHTAARQRGRSSSRSRPRQSRSESISRGQSRGRSQSVARGHSRGRSQSANRGQSRGRSTSATRKILNYPSIQAHDLRNIQPQSQTRNGGLTSPKRHQRRRTHDGATLREAAISAQRTSTSPTRKKKSSSKQDVRNSKTARKESGQNKRPPRQIRKSHKRTASTDDTSAIETVTSPTAIETTLSLTEQPDDPPFVTSYFDI